MKRILLVPTWYPTKLNPIVGSFFREQARAMMDIGYDFKVIQPQVAYYGIKSILKYIYKFLFGSAELIDNLTLIQEPDALLLVIPQNRFLTRWGNKWLHDAVFDKLSNIYLGQWRPDLIHGISYPNGVIFAEKYSKLYNKPFVLVEHNVFLLHKLAAHQIELVLQAYRNANAVGVVSEHQKKMLLMHEPDCSPQTIWNMIDEGVFNIKSKDDCSEENDFVILTITYPAPIKDYKNFLNAMKELYDIKKDFRFIMIGNDSWHDIGKANTTIFEEYAKEIGIWHIGEFIPYVARQDMGNYLKKASVFVVTSIAETYGVAAREAMMCGVPIVTTACGGVEDAITPDTGIVVGIRNPVEMASAIYKLSNNTELYNPIRIRQYSIDNFGKKVFVKNMYDFYENVAG